MVQAWYLDESVGPEDRQLELHQDPPRYVSLDELKRTTGVLHWKINVARMKEEGVLDKIRHERGYTYEDTVELSPDKIPNYKARIDIFFTEHLHADEEIRLFLDGSGYFDVRDDKDHWIRILGTKGDLLVLPRGIYHRFTPDVTNYVKVNRYFVGEPVWTPLNRPCDDHEARGDYTRRLLNGFDDEP